jgi:hypothetical protein
MVNREVGPIAYATRSGDFGLCGDRTAPFANGIGAKLGRLSRRLLGALEAQRQREVDLEIARFRRTRHGQHGA